MSLGKPVVGSCSGAGLISRELAKQKILSDKPPSGFVVNKDIVYQHIAYQDDALLIVEKPAGLLSVPGKGSQGQHCLINQLLVDFPSARVIHRLDMATSGLMVFAKTAKAQKNISMQFAERKVAKAYIAIVDGQLESCGKVVLPLMTDWPNRPKQKVCYHHGRSALTQFESLAYKAKDHTSRVLLKPQTGRSHQLRVHMMAIGHPIVGDEFYASKTALEKSPRLLLHASYLELQHPQTSKSLVFESSPAF